VLLIVSSAREGTIRQGTYARFSLWLVLPVYVRGYFERLSDTFVKEGVIKELIGSKGVNREVVVAGILEQNGPGLTSAEKGDIRGFLQSLWVSAQRG